MKLPDKITNCLFCNELIIHTSICNCGYFQCGERFVWIYLNNKLIASIDRLDNDHIYFYGINSDEYDGYLLNQFSSIIDVVNYYKKLQVFG